MVMSFMTFYLLKNVIRYFHKWSQEFLPFLHMFIQMFILCICMGCKHWDAFNVLIHRILACLACCPAWCTGHSFNNLNVLHIPQLFNHIRLEKAVFFCMSFCHHYPFSFCLSNFWNAETPTWLAREFFTLWKVFFVIGTVKGSLVVVLIFLPPE